jgi:phenylacetate-CoA ligase
MLEECILEDKQEKYHCRIPSDRNSYLADINSSHDNHIRGDMKTLWERFFDEETGIGTALTTLFYRRSYQETSRFLQQSQWWSNEQITAYQRDQLRALLDHAYRHVPYYTTLFDTYGIKPQDIRTPEDFQKIPFLTKELVQHHTKDLKATNYTPSQFEYTLTGGSTGFPLHFYVEKGVWYARHLAYIKTLLERADCHPLDPSVLLTGNIKPFEYRPFSHTLVLSSFSLTPENLQRYINKIQRLHPHYFMGYPSALTILATYMKKNAVSLDRVRALFCYGETLYDWQREFLEDVFHCRVHTQYGHREQCVLAGTCEKSNQYHVFPEYGFVELIDEQGNQVTTEGGRGEIVATGFHTGIFPFIRYRTGDLAVYTTHPCPCGRQGPRFQSIEGRVQDFVLSKTNRLVPFMGIHHLIARSTENVLECQLYQDHIGDIVVRIVPSENYSGIDERRIREGFSERFGEEFNLLITSVETIPRTPRGKYPFLVQKLSISFRSQL